MLNLKAKWENLINQETGVKVNVTLIGESKIHVFVSGDFVFDMFNFFMSHDRNIEIVDDGLIVAL